MGLEVLRSLGKVEQYAKNQTVFSQNDAGTDMYIVLKGMFGVYINSFTDFPVRVADVGQGSFFGEMAIIDGSPRSATIIAEEDSTVVVIEKKHFSLLLKRAPDVATALFETLRNRLTATAATVREAGKEPPMISPTLKIIKYKDAETSLSVMTMMAGKLREMNKLLEAMPEPEAKPDEKPEAIPPAQKTVKLLPAGYVPYNIPDENDNDDLLREAEFVCPYCAIKFSAHIPLYSGLVKARETLDGRIIFSNLNILAYTNVICPNCNYTDTYLEFGKPRNHRTHPKIEGNQFPNAEGFTNYSSPRNHSLDEAILSYHRNIDCLSKTTEDPLRYAKAWIRLYWLYGDQNSADFAENAARQALYYYNGYSDKCMDFLTDDNKLRLNAILGELSAALGDYPQALEHYANIETIGKNVKSDFVKNCKARAKEIAKL